MYEKTIYEAQKLEDAQAALDGDKPRLITSIDDVRRILGRTTPPRCAEAFCKSTARPYCHCQLCGETDRFLSDHGYCAECIGAELGAMKRGQ